MWEKLKLPFICERMVAFSIPQRDAVWVMTWDALFQVTLAPDANVLPVLRSEEELDGVFDEDRNLLIIGEQAYPMLGLYGGVPILTNELSDQLSLEPNQDRLVVLNSERQVKQIIEFSDLSGDWRWATFSANGHYLLIGVPYDLFIYRWRSPYNHCGATD